jgi:hypothetical protein
MNTVSWDVMPYGSCKSRRFRGTYGRRRQGGNNQRARNNAAVTSNSCTSSVLSCYLLLTFLDHDSFHLDDVAGSYKRNNM